MRLPSGVVTFLFSDVEGSTQLLERHPTLMGGVLARHYELFEQAIAAHQGIIFETVGDAVYAAFHSPDQAISAALASQGALAREDWGLVGHLNVRIAIHGGPVERRGDHYFGAALFRCARLQNLAHGGQTLISGTTASEVRGLPDEAALIDLGRHRLKDLAEPESVFQLEHPGLRQRFPPLRSLDAHPHNLPPRLTSFVGRESECIALAELAQRERFVTVTGTGGIGKTSLALEAAARIRERFDDGAFLVDLAPVNAPRLVEPAIAESLGLAETEGIPIATTLVSHLADLHLLLILDNFEHLLDAAPVVGLLLQGAPSLHVLVTSRAPLRLAGEIQQRLDPLPVSTQEATGALPGAIRLFLDRARAVGATIQDDEATRDLLGEICGHLDGLPLAIELASARLRHLPLAALREQLRARLRVLGDGPRNAPTRHQTLRATIGWSEDLLEPSARTLFRRLAVWVDGFTLAGAAASLAPTDHPATDPLSLVADLVDHSLIQPVEGNGPEPRYRMLETVREYAAEQLRRSGEEPLACELRLTHLADVAERFATDVETDRMDEALRSLVIERPNLLATIHDALDRADIRGVEMAVHLRRFWSLRVPFGEGHRVFQRALQLQLPHDLHAHCTHIAGELAATVGELERARELLLQAVQEFSDLGDARYEGAAVNDLGLVYHQLGDLEHLEAVAHRSHELFALAGDRRGLAISLANLAEVKVMRGLLEDAEVHARASVDAWRQLRDSNGTATGLATLAGIRLRRGDLGDARRSASEALEIAESADDSIGRVEARLVLADLAMRDARDDLAVALLRAAEDDAVALNDVSQLAEIRERLAALSEERM